MNCVPWIFEKCYNCGCLSLSGNSVRPALEVGLYTSPGVSCDHPQQGEHPPRRGHKGSGNHLLVARNHENKKALQSFSLSRANVTPGSSCCSPHCWTITSNTKAPLPRARARARLAEGQCYKLCSHGSLDEALAPCLHSGMVCRELSIRR